jgi:hypothetical protein
MSAPAGNGRRGALGRMRRVLTVAGTDGSVRCARFGTIDMSATPGNIHQSPELTGFPVLHDCLERGTSALAQMRFSALA